MAEREFNLLLNDDRVKAIVISKFSGTLVPDEQVMVEAITVKKQRLRHIGPSLQAAAIQVLIMLNHEEPRTPHKYTPKTKLGHAPTAEQKKAHERKIGANYGKATTGLSLPDQSSDVL